MIYKEETRDLFSVSEDYFFAQCISSDFAMGKGIATEFNNRFDIKNKLKDKYGSYVHIWEDASDRGFCVQEGKVFNLITKQFYWQKPTYQTIECALRMMKTLCSSKVKKIAMPLIGCGLDRLEWNKVSDIIKKIFKDSDIEILICIKEDDHHDTKRGIYN